MPIRHIVVATDFAEPSERALAWGARIARLHGSRLTLVHAVSPPMPVADFAAPPLAVDEQVREAARERLERALREGHLAGIEADTVLADGLPSQAILDAADETGADLVVVGTRGLTGFRHLLLGSTAERIVQGARVPVLSVHAADEVPPAGLRTFLVPTDFSADAEAALATADQCFAPLEAETRVILLHVYHVPAEYRSYGAGSFSRWSEKLSAQVGERLETVAAPLRRQGHEIEVVTAEGTPSEVIVREAAERGADLIAMGTHGRSGLAHLLLGSTAERVVQHAPCPVLTLPRSD